MASGIRTAPEKIVLPGEYGTKTPPEKAPYKRIATEEAWSPQEIIDEYWKLIDTGPLNDPGFVVLWGMGVRKNPAQLKRLLDMDETRIADMDATGIDVQVLMLTAPGVQVFEPDLATNLARNANDYLAEAIKRHPDRYVGTVAVAPQNPKEAAKEIERGIKTLGLNGVIINSHTRGEYLDDPKFWEIFEAAEACNAPIYIHPQTPSPAMVKPYIERGLTRAILGYAHEVSLHTMGIIVAGVFDRFPNLKIGIGHGGEGLPFMMYRLDYMYQNRLEPYLKRTKKRPSDYLKENMFITNSGLAWEPAIKMCMDVMGADRVLYAMDYPYQYHVEEVHMMDRLDLTPEEKKMFFQTNAENFFHFNAK